MDLLTDSLRPEGGVHAQKTVDVTQELLRMETDVLEEAYEDPFLRVEPGPVLKRLQVIRSRPRPPFLDVPKQSLVPGRMRVFLTGPVQPHRELGPGLLYWVAHHEDELRFGNEVVHACYGLAAQRGVAGCDLTPHPP